MFSEHAVEISDDWTPDDWLAVIQALDKPRAYLGTSSDAIAFGKKIDDAWKRLQVGGVEVAYDIGCAEGTFTEVWLTLLHRWTNKYPSVVVLLEPDETLLSLALRRLQARFPHIVFKAVANTLEEAVLADDGALRDAFRPQLIVASHSCYYLRAERSPH